MTNSLDKCPRQDCGRERWRHKDHGNAAVEDQGHGVREEALDHLYSCATQHVHNHKFGELNAARGCWPKFEGCEGVARWAVFHDRVAFERPFNHDKSVYVAACNSCLVGSLGADPTAINFVRPLHVVESIAPVVSPDVEESPWQEYARKGRESAQRAERVTGDDMTIRVTAPVASPDDLCFRCEQRRGDHNRALCINFVERPVVSPSSEPLCDVSVQFSADPTSWEPCGNTLPCADHTSPTDTNTEKS